MFRRVLCSIGPSPRLTNAPCPICRGRICSESQPHLCDWFTPTRVRVVDIPQRRGLATTYGALFFSLSNTAVFRSAEYSVPSLNNIILTGDVLTFGESHFVVNINLNSAWAAFLWRRMLWQYLARLFYLYRY